MSRCRAIIINPADNVAVALDPLQSGDQILDGVQVSADIPAGHKVALADISTGGKIVKYGWPIGHAKQAIKRGEQVHTHNLSTDLGEILTYDYQPQLNDATGGAACERTFDGYMRAKGDAGIRNDIWIIPTVGCVNKIAEAIAAKCRQNGMDDVFCFTHPYGCSQLGDDHYTTQKILAGLVHHPNAGGVLVLGLGCENNNIAEFTPVLGDFDAERVRFLNCQDVPDEVAEGAKVVTDLHEKASRFERVPVPLSKLRLGVKCGGSDAFSGITANPLVGMVTDMLASCGGTTILSEVPEMFGAEQLLMNRCVSREVFDKTVSMVNEFKNYFTRHEQVIYENPSPGNKAGGITTLEEKSLGCTQKAGTCPVVDVLPYGGRVSKPGLNLMSGPGNDIVSTTALAAAGAHIVLFTTGRGTPLGGPVPTLKLATNSRLATNKANWIDFNAGVLLEGKDASEAAAELFGLVLEIASGKPTANEINGYREIAIFKDGVTL